MKFIRRRLLRRIVEMRRFVVHNLLHADDPPHRLALGVAIGMFFTFTPFLGAQMVLVVACAWLLGANKIVGLPLVWISNPATFVPIFYPCYRIGRWLLGQPGMGPQWWRQLAAPPEGAWEATQFYWTRILEIFAPLMLGCAVVALPIATASYFATRSFVARYRAAHSAAGRRSKLRLGKCAFSLEAAKVRRRRRSHA